MTETNVRHVLCLECGAPARMTEGKVENVCEFCGAALTVPEARPPTISFQGPDLGLSPEDAEKARMKSLRRQSDDYDEENPYAFIVAPEDLEYIAATDEHDEEIVPMALAAFKMAVQRLEASNDDFQAQRRVFWLSRQLENLWNVRDESGKARAVVETAAHVLTDPGYRQMLFCSMASLAIGDGDLDDAEEWLSRCDPRPPHLDVDTWYRTQRGTLLLERERWEEALALVGEEMDAIPFDPASVFTFNSIRIEALERLGRHEEADREMKAMLEEAEEEGFDESEAEEMFSDSDLMPATGEVLERHRRKQRAREELDGGPARPGLWSVLVALVPLVVALSGFMALLESRQQSAAWSDWKSTRGRVLEVGVEVYSDDDSTSWYPQVVYEYTVGDSTYTSDEFGQRREAHDSEAQARLAAREWKNSDEVTVWYDPENPADSALDVSRDPLVPLFWVLIVVGLLVGLVTTPLLVVRIVRYVAHRKRWSART